MLQPDLLSRSPNDYESEKASNSYLMSLVAIMVGLPLPVINLVTSLAFYFGNRRGTPFVRWHCTQVLLAQGITFVFNAAGVYWTIHVVFGDGQVSNVYISYVISIVCVNLVEFAATMYAAIRTRKGKHVSWWFFGPLTDQLVKI